MRNKLIGIVILSVLCAVLLPAQSQERAIDDALKTLAGILADDLATGKAKVVAITEFGNPDGTTGNASGALGRYIGYVFPAYLREAGGGRFALVDRDATARLLAEQEFQLSTLGSPEGAVKVGNFLACDSLVTGTIDAADAGALTVAAKALNVETGTVLGGFAKRLPLSLEVKALVGVAEVSAGSAARLGVANAHEKTAPYGLRVIASGAAKKTVNWGGQDWIVALPGETYTIELRNDTDRRVAVALLIDGLNTAFMRREAPSEAVKWVLAPRSTVVIGGWQVDDASARQFVFTGKANSLAAARGFGGEIGLISASFYPEELSPKSGAAPQSGAESQQAGTGAGKAVASALRRVSLHLENFPAQVSVLRYDYAAGLAARGIAVGR